MKILFVKHTDNSPALLFVPSGNFYILGRSVMMKPDQFYHCIEDWMKDYIKCPAPLTTLSLALDTMHADTTRYLALLFIRLNTIRQSGHDVIVNWYYERDDEEMKETISAISSLHEWADIRSAEISSVREIIKKARII